MLPLNQFLYGCDYNPEQWKDQPEILDEDIRLMKKAGCNVVSLGIFAWSELEPAEGLYNFTFFDKVVDRLEANGIHIILATPSGARPAWMAQKYPEVLRVDSNGTRHHFGGRHNHCFTSPVYRKKVQQINEQLALRYGHRKAVIAWHVSNEYGGDCRCTLCVQAFRDWLKVKYHNNLALLNHQWWNAFWSHTYTDWSQIEPPMNIGETEVHGLSMDWRRFVTCQTLDFYRCEVEPLKRIAPQIPVTTNFHTDFYGVNDWAFRNDVDIVAWDVYPAWHREDLKTTACSTAFVYDIGHSMKDRPFLLMESTPSLVNWHEYCKLKRPGVNKLASLQAISCGADSVQYFQWRKSRGGSEKFHGAVIDHYGKEDTRVFTEVAQLGALLKELGEITGSKVVSQVAILFDWKNLWALHHAAGFHKSDKKYREECEAHYRYFWENGFNVDVIDSHQDLNRYKIVVAPMLYMVSDEAINRLTDYVRCGGTLVSGYMSGYVNENDLCYLGGFPAEGLKDVFGIWNEEIDTLYPEEENRVAYNGRFYSAVDYCEHIHAQGAEVIATFQEDFLQGTPAVTRHSFGNGTAYYLAFRGRQDFLNAFYQDIFPSEYQLPESVFLRKRVNETHEYLFLQNWGAADTDVAIPGDWETLPGQCRVSDEVSVPGGDSIILKGKKKE